MTMLNLRLLFKKLIFAIVILFLVGLVACSPKTPSEIQLLETPEIEIEATSISETFTISITPEVLPTVLLVVGDAGSSYLISQIQAVLEDLTEAESMQLLIVENLLPEMITPEVQIIIGLGSNLDLNASAEMHPEIAFLAIDNPTAVVTDNVSIMGDPANARRQKAFLAGYLSALISYDNKILGLIAEGDPESGLLAESFVVGARFYCGICNPIYPPYNPFPQWESVSAATVISDLGPIINHYINIGVDIVYVQGELLSPELLTFLEELAVKVVSDKSPDILISNWAGTVTVDTAQALVKIWPDLLAKAPGKQVPQSIVLDDQQMGFVSPGRYRMFENMVAELESGLASVEVAP